ncbi:hypothetical protein PAPYR_9640 [Paratrimastix pyriformis]|uniref:Exocyst complex component Sec6 n=1 Tax=Paratrimastix pyriformis TaxID=342808 RepID=A0ABQ8UBJ6_9EUKA|nr:hypothetical protein PAPYR_9640 [Paratrimastix pyriformis]
MDDIITELATIQEVVVTDCFGNRDDLPKITITKFSNPVQAPGQSSMFSFTTTNVCSRQPAPRRRKSSDDPDGPADGDHDEDAADADADGQPSDDNPPATPHGDGDEDRPDQADGAEHDEEGGDEGEGEAGERRNKKKGKRNPHARTFEGYDLFNYYVTVRFPIPSRHLLAHQHRPTPSIRLHTCIPSAKSATTSETIHPRSRHTTDVPRHPFNCIPHTRQIYPFIRTTADHLPPHTHGDRFDHAPHSSICTLLHNPPAATHARGQIYHAHVSELFDKLLKDYGDPAQASQMVGANLLKIVKWPKRYIRQLESLGVSTERFGGADMEARLAPLLDTYAASLRQKLSEAFESLASQDKLQRIGTALCTDAPILLITTLNEMLDEVAESFGSEDGLMRKLLTVQVEFLDEYRNTLEARARQAAEEAPQLAAQDGNLFGTPEDDVPANEAAPFARMVTVVNNAIKYSRHYFNFPVPSQCNTIHLSCSHGPPPRSTPQLDGMVGELINKVSEMLPPQILTLRLGPDEAGGASPARRLSTTFSSSSIPVSLMPALSCCPVVMAGYQALLNTCDELLGDTILRVLDATLGPRWQMEKLEDATSNLNVVFAFLNEFSERSVVVDTAMRTLGVICNAVYNLVKTDAKADIDEALKKSLHTACDLIFNTYEPFGEPEVIEARMICLTSLVTFVQADSERILVLQYQRLKSSDPTLTSADAEKLMKRMKLPRATIAAAMADITEGENQMADSARRKAAVEAGAPAAPLDPKQAGREARQAEKQRKKDQREAEKRAREEDKKQPAFKASGLSDFLS